MSSKVSEGGTIGVSEYVIDLEAPLNQQSCIGS